MSDRNDSNYVPDNRHNDYSIDSNAGYNSNYNDVYEQPYYTRAVQNDSRPQDKANKVLAQSFFYMFIALIISAVTSLYVASSESLLEIFVFGGGYTILLFAEIIIVFASNVAIKSNSIIASSILYILYSVCNGATCAVVLLAYTGESVISIFMVTAAVFAAISIYAATTKRDLTTIGIIGYMGLFGFVIISLVSMLFGSTVNPFFLIVGLALFVGITAYDVQKIKEIASVCVDSPTTIVALFGAFQLYLDFINIFLKLIALFGKRRN